MQQNVLLLLQHTKKSIKMWKASVTLELKATTRIWRESGDWVALHNIKNRGSTHKSNKEITQVTENPQGPIMAHTL